MNYNEAMNYIKEVGNFGSNYGLERTYKLLEVLGNPQNEIKLIHVAGTNGKGSTTAMISKMLMGLGYKVGMYTSPYLEEFEERIQINNDNIPKSILAELVTEIREAVNKVQESGYGHPTEFEMITVLMFLYFYRENVDFGVIEVGLGGRLDSTNVIYPLLSIITSISYDHVNILGDTLAAIATEKCGIIKEGVPVISYPQASEALQVIKSICESKSCDLYKIDRESVKILEIIKLEKTYQLISVNSKYTVKLPLLGEHQSINLAIAIKAIETLSERGYITLQRDKIEKSLESVEWKGRLEILNNKPLVVIDAAHNIQGIKMLKDNLNKYFNYKNLYLILGILADKEVEEMVKVITPLAKKVFAVTPHSDRAELAEDLKEEILKYNPNCEAYNEYEKAYENAISEANEDDLILASGSLYMIGDMRKIIRKH